MKYYEVVVELETEVPAGKNGTRIKKIKEHYLVEGESITYVEAQVNEFLKECMWPFMVKSVKESNIIEVITNTN